jgi:hypothetical protein
VRYHRRFSISASHFNSEYEYQAYERLRKRLILLEPAVTMGVDDVRRCLSNIHGQGDWLVDDSVLESIVMEWNNKNLSIIPDFEGMRATTERMASILVKKLQVIRGGQDLEWLVRVYENKDIYAEATNVDL